MKYYSKVINLIVLLTLSLPSSAELALLSGSPSSWQKRVTQKFLKDNALDREELVKWDKENMKAMRNLDVILQLCFRDEDVVIIHQRKKIIKNTLRQLVEINEKTEKAFQRKAL
jgi:16S rRNA G1207 methylase RsmC